MNFPSTKGTTRASRPGVPCETRSRASPINLKKLDRETPQGGVPDHIGWPGAKIYDGHTPNELDRPAKTVKAGVHGVPGGESVMLLDDRKKDEGSGEWSYLHRYMTVRETARVMTFRDDWKLKGPAASGCGSSGTPCPSSWVRSS